MYNFPVMNSIFNEQPTRKITSEFVEKAVGDASITYTNPGTVQQTSSGVGAFRFMLESNIGKVKNWKRNRVQVPSQNGIVYSTRSIKKKCNSVSTYLPSLSDDVGIPRTDDSLSVAALERQPQSHERASVLATGSGPTLLKTASGRRYAQPGTYSAISATCRQKLKV